MASRLEFRILGPLSVRVDGEPVPIGGPKQRALLALLLLGANRVVSRDRLIGELFAEQSVNSADHALRNHVSRLRKVLGPAVGHEPRLVARPPGYLLRVDPGELDLERFERLAADGREALAAGDALAAAGSFREAEALWEGQAARRPRVRAVCTRRGRASGRAAACQRRGANRCGAGARLSTRAGRRDRVVERGASLPRALPRSADARALPVGPSGRGARGLSADTSVPERRTRARTRRRAAGARARDPHAGPRRWISDRTVSGSRRASETSVPTRAWRRSKRPMRSSSLGESGWSTSFRRASQRRRCLR